jgi:aminopeptidase N
MGDKKPFERLPKVVKPKHYDLFLQPDLKAFTFNGHTKISVDVGHQIAKKIVLIFASFLRWSLPLTKLC